MFCPRCRTFTDAPTPSANNGGDPDVRCSQKGAPPTHPRRSVAPEKLRHTLKPLLMMRSREQGRRCASCNSLLTFDRMAAEFPEQRLADDASQNAASADGGKTDSAAASGTASSASQSDAPVTIQEILRATAGPNPISGVGDVPLDQRQPSSTGRREPGSIGGRRKEDADYVASRYQASETAQRRNRERKQREIDANWRHSESPRIPRGFGCKPWTHRNLEVALGLGTLAAVALLVVSMTLRIFYAPSILYTPALHPVARVVNASALGYAPALTATAAKQPPKMSPVSITFPATPALVAAHWRRIGLPISFPSGFSSALASGREDVAVYGSLADNTLGHARRVRVWVQHLRSDADAFVCLTSTAERRRQLQAMEAGMRQAAIHWQTVAGRKTAVFDAFPGGSDASEIPGEAAIVSLRAWQQGRDVVTVAAGDASVRDAFARDYINQSL